MKEIVILGGPNGAGKTTAARVLLPDFLKLHMFVNADELARTEHLGPFAAGRLMLERMRELISVGDSFAIETTCAGKSYAPVLTKCRQMGWRITLFYLWLSSSSIAVDRVATRVRQGGHGIPVDTIRRRFHSGVRNLLQLYLPLADTAAIYDNGGVGRTLIAEKELGKEVLVLDQARWEMLEEQIRCS